MTSSFSFDILSEDFELKEKVDVSNVHDIKTNLTLTA